MVYCFGIGFSTVIENPFKIFQFILFFFNFATNTLQYLNIWLTYLIDNDLIVWQKRNNNTYEILLGMAYFKKEKERNENKQKKDTQYTTYNNLKIPFQFILLLVRLTQ